MKVLFWLVVLSFNTQASEFYHKCTPTSTNEIEQIGCNIYFEGRNQGILGQVAIAFATIHRMESAKFPNTAREVVWQYKQFSWANDNKPDVITNYKAFKRALQIASIVYNLPSISFNMLSPIEGALYYHEESITPYWVDKKCRVGKIGAHIFYSCARKK
jgi:N-acetylmuramoyl-L-alanine amidase